MTDLFNKVAAAFAAVLIMGMSFAAIIVVPVQPAYAAAVASAPLA